MDYVWKSGSCSLAAMTTHKGMGSRVALLCPLLLRFETHEHHDLHIASTPPSTPVSPQLQWSRESTAAKVRGLNSSPELVINTVSRL